MEQLSGLLVGRDGKSENRELACWVEVRERPTLYSERINQTRALRKGWGTLVIVRDRKIGRKGGPPGRRNRCLLPDIPCHITQRGVDRREVFSADQDRNTYLGLLRENLSDAGVRILGYCLMSNHVHLVAVPAKEDSLSILLRRAHGRYARYYNARAGRSGHLWQNRFFACMLGASHPACG